MGRLLALGLTASLACAPAGSPSNDTTGLAAATETGSTSGSTTRSTAETITPDGTDTTPLDPSGSTSAPDTDTSSTGEPVVPTVTVELVTDQNRHYPEMHGGWGPHLRAPMLDAEGNLWLAYDGGPSVLENTTIHYARRGDTGWQTVASQPHTAGVQQNAAHVLRGNFILTYAVNTTQHFLEECYLDTTNYAYAACNALQIGGPYATPGSSNYVGAALGPGGETIVWFTVVGAMGGTGQLVYTYDYGGGWNGPVVTVLPGWNDIGYNFLVDRYGTIFEGRSGGVDRAVIGAQAQGYNSFSTGISCIGSFGEHSLPKAAMEAVARLIAWKLPLHGAPVTGGLTVVSGGGSLNAHPYGAKVRMQRIAGHRDGDATDCPGDRLYHQLPALRTLTASYHGDPTQTGGQPTMTIVPASRAVPYRGTLVVRGALVDASGGAIAGRGLVVEKQGRSGKWVRIATARTGSDGHWEASAVWKAAGRVRARARVSGVQIISGSVAVKLAARRR